jgi:3-oxoisoapionate decarboxylase
MRLGVSSFAYRYAMAYPPNPLDAAGVLARAAALGLEAVQFCDNISLDELPPAAIHALVAASRDLGVAIEVGVRGLDPAQPAHRARLIANLDLCLAVGCRTLRLALDPMDLDHTRERGDAEAIRAALAGFVPELRARGLRLALENRLYLPTALMAAVLAAINDPAVVTCVDVANSLGLMERPLESVAALAPWAAQMHVKDFVVTKVPVGYHVTGRPIGEGWLDLPAVLTALGPRRQEMDFYIEQWMEPEPTPEATLAKEQRWVVHGAQALRAALTAKKLRSVPSLSDASLRKPVST